MAPEQAASEAITPRCDLFSLGCVLYALLAGRPPFRGKSIAEVVHKVRYEHPEPITKYASDVPRDLQQIISELLEKNPEDRFQSVEEMLPELISFFLTVEADSDSQNSRAGGYQFGDSIAGPITRVIFRSMKKIVDTSNKRQFERFLGNANRIRDFPIVVVVVVILVMIVAGGCQEAECGSGRRRRC